MSPRYETGAKISRHDSAVLLDPGLIKNYSYWLYTHGVGGMQERRKGEKEKEGGKGRKGRGLEGIVAALGVFPRPHRSSSKETSHALTKSYTRQNMKHSTAQNKTIFDDTTVT
jgi:hypothetical protein